MTHYILNNFSPEKEKVWHCSPHMGGGELKYVHDAFETNWIAPLGPNVDGFEKELSVYTKAAYAAGLSSGTAALHLALRLLNIADGDEVCVQSFTFSASANPILYERAIPVFIDSEERSWNMCPSLLEEAIKDRIKKGKKPKAVIAVHLYGMPFDIQKIHTLCQEYEIHLIEDAAESLGSKFDNVHTGTTGILGILSFNGNKIITTSGGGALLSNSQSLIEKAKFLSTQARDKAPHYQHSHVGFNYRLSNVLAGIGRGQLEVIDKRVAQKRDIFNRYKTSLKELKGITFQEEPNSLYFSNRWITTVLFNDAYTDSAPLESSALKHYDTASYESSLLLREKVRTALEVLNIEARPLWKPLHLQPIFSSFPYYGGNRTSELLFKKGLCLPSGTNMSEEVQKKICDVIQFVLENESLVKG
jgi:dTDP-4-amino-4,6-dideoxygalactose transaminase